MINLLESLSGARVLVIGDAMLDRYIAGSVSRISPEAPVPVLNVSHETSMPGGAANVAANIAALGGRAVLVSAIGPDPAGHMLKTIMRSYTRIETHFVTDPNRVTPTKTRCIAGQHMLRIDAERAEPLTNTSYPPLIKAFREQIDNCDAVVLSDYAKGVLHAPAEIIDVAKRHGKPVIVDPKGDDWSRYHGADLITPNAAELAAATGRPTETEQEVEIAAILTSTPYVVTTRGPRGMSFTDRDGHAVHIPQECVGLADITGAGDTVTAVMGACAAVGADWEQAARLANLTARIVVQKIGTAVARPDEIRAEIERTGRPSTDASPNEITLLWRRQGKTIGFTNGCFDLLHAGHIHLLTEARKHCDRLIVGVNSDESAQHLKGDSRPIEGQIDRLVKVALLRPVDAATLFPEDTPARLIAEIRPDVLIKGAEYEDREIAGSEHAGRVVLIPMLEGKGTTGTIEKIKGDA